MIDWENMDCRKCPYKKTCKEMGEIELSCEDIKRIAEGEPYREGNK